MGKQENIVLSVEAVKEILRDLFKKQEQTLLAIVSNSTKLIHQRLDKLGADIIDINEIIKKNVKDVDELKQSLQIYEDTNDKKLLEIDNSIKGHRIERIAQIKQMQQVHNKLKEKLRNLEDRSRRDNLRIDGIPEYEEESCDNTEELLKDALREKLGVNKFQIERAHRNRAKEGGKDRTIVAKFSSYKGKERLLNEDWTHKREGIIYTRISPKQLWLLGKKTGRK